MGQNVTKRRDPMQRRDFLLKTGCLFAGLIAAPSLFKQEIASGATNEQKYKIDIEIYEVNGFCYYGRHRKGDRFAYPKDWGKLCPYLRGSMLEFIRQLEAGETLPWTYAGTPYAKVINQDGITTEFVRCPDPSTTHVVAKIIRTEIPRIELE